MATAWMSSAAVHRRGRFVSPLGLAFLLHFLGCVDTTPPWQKGKAQGGAGGTADAPLAGTGGAGGALDGPGLGGTLEAGGPDLNLGRGGAGGAIDAAGGGGGIDVGQGGGGGTIDGLAGSGGTTSVDLGGPDVPLGGSGGGRGGATGSGGTSGLDGGAGTGGTTAKGGTSGGGGTSSTGGTTTPDAPPDVPPDAPSDPPPDTSTLGTGLVVYYTCESASGSVLPDSSGKGNDGTLVNGVAIDGGTASTGTGYSFAKGKVGNGLTLLKSGYGHVRVPPAVFANATDISIAFWVNMATAQNWARVFDTGVYANIFNNSSTGTKYLNFVPKNYTTNLLFSISVNGYSNEQTLTATNLPTAVWKHVAIVLGGGVGSLYIDGALSSASNSVTLRPADVGAIDYAFLGKSQFDADPYFDGSLDEFRVYSRALSATEVTALYQFAGP
jgi:hypothetical protein